MKLDDQVDELKAKYLVENDHAASDYFGLIRGLLKLKQSEPSAQDHIDDTYALVKDEILTNQAKPINDINFGTSGWRGFLGKDVFIKSVSWVTEAIIDLYREADQNQELHGSLGVSSLAEAQRRGCLVGWDNRFGGGGSR